MEFNLISWLFACAPVIVVLVLMLGFRWGGSKAGAVGWFVAIGVAALGFGAGPAVIGVSQVKAILLTVDVLYIIWTALLLFHIADEAGAVRIIGEALPRLTPDRMTQGLLLGWLFASFLQGMGGFGVPVAVAAPLLVGMGFTPIQAVAMACIGHGWAVNFGSLATSFQTLIAVTNLPGETLAPSAAIMLGIACFASGGIVAVIAGGWRGLLRGLPAVLILSAVMGIAQYLLATNGLWTLGATGAAMIGMVAGLGVVRLPIYRTAKHNRPLPADAGGGSPPDAPRRSIGIALSAYIVLVILAFAVNLIEPLNAALDGVKFTLPFPAVATSYGWTTPAENGREISLLTHPGAILLCASAIAFLIYSRAGYYTAGAARRILQKTVRGSVNSSLGIAAMVSMAALMSHAGMTNLLAQGLSQSVGQTFYPALAPFIGALGAFITGSNNNSNVLFGALQQRAAELLGLSVPLILGAQTAGGSLGSVMAPAKVIVGCSTVGLSDNEGLVMRPVIAYGLIPVAVVAVVATIMALA